MTALPRIGVLGAAFVWTAASFGTLVAPAPAAARAAGPVYVAQLETPAAERVVIARGTAWTCEGTRCVAGKAASRPVNVCARLAREAGTVVSFTAEGESLPAEDLARCNG